MYEKLVKIFLRPKVEMSNILEFRNQIFSVAGATVPTDKSLKAGTILDIHHVHVCTFIG